MKTSILNWGGKLLIKLLRVYTPALLALIPSPALAAAVAKLFARVEEIIAALTDEDPNDAEQVGKVLRRFVSEDAVPIADGVIEEKLLLITNDRARRGLTLFSAPVMDTLRLLTDEDPDNAAQAEVVFDTFVLDRANQDFLIADLLVPVLEQRITNPMLRAILMETLESGLRQGATDLAEIDVFTSEATIKAIEDAKIKADAEAKAAA